jgi:hypothetical protein
MLLVECQALSVGSEQAHVLTVLHTSAHQVGPASTVLMQAVCHLMWVRGSTGVQGCVRLRWGPVVQILLWQG